MKLESLLKKNKVFTQIFTQLTDISDLVFQNIKWSWEHEDRKYMHELRNAKL